MAYEIGELVLAVSGAALAFYVAVLVSNRWGVGAAVMTFLAVTLLLAGIAWFLL